MGMQGVRMPGRNVQANLMSFVSELGYASWPDIVSNNEAFEQANTIVPAAVSHKKLEKQLREAFKITGFDKAFPDLQKYCLEEQKIHGIANKRMMEATRANPDVSGYCIHALTDGDWILGASILDLWRNPKTFAYKMTKEANQPQIVSIRVLPRNIYANKGGKIQVIGINELENAKVDINLKVETKKGKQIFSKTFSSTYLNGVSELYNEVLNSQDLKGSYIVKVIVKDSSGEIITSNKQSFDVFSAKQLKAPIKKIAVLESGKTIANHLKKHNYEYVPFSTNLDLSIPVIVGSLKSGDQNFKDQVEEIKAFVNKGGYAIFLSIKGDNLTWGAPNPNPKPIDADDDWQKRIPREIQDMEIDQLPFNANLYATNGNYISRNHIVTKSLVFKGLPVNVLMSGVYENVCADRSICRPADGKYIAGVITYDQNKNMDIMLRHYNGIGDVQWAADVLLVEKGKGKMLFSTLKIIANLGKDPVADKLLHNMIDL